MEIGPTFNGNRSESEDPESNCNRQTTMGLHNMQWAIGHTDANV